MLICWSFDAADTNGEEDVFIDQMAVQFQQGLLSDPKSVEKQCGEMLPA